MKNEIFTLIKSNREERHFGFLFISELLNNNLFREKVFNYIMQTVSVTDSVIELDVNNFNVFAEVSILRDYWHGLGSYDLDYENTHQNRLLVLNKLLEIQKRSYINLKNETMFWTTKNNASIEKPKLWSPAQWDIHELNRLDENVPEIERQLKQIRWAFRAKPDLMIDCPKAFVFVEFKVESSIGQNEHGYDQVITQNKIAGIIKDIIPLYKEKNFAQLTLALDKNKSELKWSKILEFLKDSKRDSIAYQMVCEHFLANSLFK